MRFFELSESMFGLFFTWALVIFVLCAWNFLNSFRQKRKKYIWLSAAVFFITYIVIQIMLDIKYMREGKKSTVIADFMGYLPVESWAVYIALCMIASVIITAYYVHWKKENITVMSIKDSIDTLQAGLCYWKDGGQVILSNRKMNDLCFDITGEALLNGELFFEAIDKECIEMSDGTIINKPTLAEIVKKMNNTVFIQNEETTLKCLKEGQKTFEDILKYIADNNEMSMRLSQFMLVGSTIRSYITYLYNEGKITWHFKNNKMYWKIPEREKA